MRQKYSRARLMLSGVAAIPCIATLVWLLAHSPQSAPVPADESAPSLAATNGAGKQSAPTPPQDAAVQAPAPAASRLEVLENFRDWVSRYQQESDAALKARLEAEGEALALQRRDAMARLIEEDPQRALQETLPFAQRQQLPASIAGQIEQVVSGRGTLGVLGVLPEEQNEAPGIVRTAQFGDKTYRAFVYGRRLAQMTTQNIPLHGIAVGDALALAESPVRVLDAAEAAARASEVAPENARCPVSGSAISVADAAAVVDVGGQIRILCNGGHIQVLEGQLLAAESGGGTVLASGTLDSWAQGPKTLLYIRVRFSDQTSDPQTLADSQTMITNVDSFFREGSYETTTIAATFTPVYTLSNNTAYYVSNDIYAVRNDALAIAKADGYDSVNWNLDAVRYNGGPGSFSGAAYVHARGCWLKSSSAGVAAHEFGHNYGLYHANSLNPTDESPIGPGTWQEYGDTFDTMGGAGAGAYHYCARYKNVLNWIPSDGFLTASNSGTYRVYAHDIITSSNLIRGLRVPRDSNKNYWVEFRQKFTGNVWLMNGAGLRRADNSNNNNPGSELLDVSPNSPDGKNDSSLLIGRTFSDVNAGVHITPIGKGGTSPESLDVVVNYGAFPGNSAPSLAISASSTTVPVGTAVTLTATASDPNGDTLAYFWDFDDKTYGFNTSSTSKSWSTGGEYVVRCVVSDMKGGTASRWIVISVGSPTTFRVSGRVTDSNGNPMEGVRVHNGQTSTAYRGCFTDADGYYTVARLAAGSYTMGAAFYGSTFAVSGFTNPVTVGPSKTGVDFIGTIKTYSIAGRITDGGVAVADVQVTDGFRTATSNTNGDYTIGNVPNGSYTMTATKAGYSLVPSGWANPLSVADAAVANVNFVTPTYTVSGEITGVSTTNIVTITDGYRTTTSYKQGNGNQTKNVFSLSGVPAGNWNIRALQTGLSFSPSTFSNPLNVSGNLSSKNFSLDGVTTYSVSGSISYNGVGLPGVTISAGSRSSLTDSRGGYFISGLSNGTYTVVPSLSGYGFTPGSINVAISGAHVTGQNFVASQVTVPTITLTATDADASEPGSNTGLFTVTRNGSTATGLVVFYAVNGTATSGADYVALPGSVTIPSGSASATITVTPLDDSQVECPETVVVTLTANGSYIVGSPAATVTITDNDLPAVTVTALDAFASEVGGDTGTLQFTRNGCLSSPLTVAYSLGGTATPGADYQALPGSVTIPAGAASVTITITPIDDLLVEGDETVIVTVAASGSYTVGSPSSASVTIYDNETNHAPTANAGPDQTISILGIATLNGSATDDGLPGGGLTYSWSKISGPGTAVAANPTAQNTTAFFSMIGTYVLRLTVSDGALSASDDVTVTVTAADPAKVVNAVNAGGADVTSGFLYRADTWFTGGTPNTTSTTVAGTSDGALYQTERSGNFSYDIPVSGGVQTYLLALKFAETAGATAGQRLFDVLVDDVVVGHNLDICTQAGVNIAFDLILPITSTNDVLSVQFQTAAGSPLPAKVNAIVVAGTQVLSPAASASLTASAVSGSQINLSWTDDSANETGFQIDVSTDGINFVPLATVGANVTAYSHTGLNPSTAYYYRVSACNGVGCSSEATASATTQGGPPSAPTNLTGVAQNASQINLSWVQNSANEDGFIIERSLNGSSFQVIATTGPNATAFASTGLQKGTRYYFRVRAFNSLGYSAYSNTINVRTKQK